MSTGTEPPAGLPQALHLQTGRSGEDTAARYLHGLGYAVIARNVRLKHDEIDIVAWDPTDRVLVFAEVKARRGSGTSFHPTLNATRRKKSRALRAARRWVADHDWQGGYRLDLLSVAGGRVIGHVQDWGVLDVARAA